MANPSWLLTRGSSRWGDSLWFHQHLPQNNTLIIKGLHCRRRTRHQETPAPNVVNDLCIHLGQAAAPATKAVGYHNAGIVELIVDTISGQFHYMEMNPRLQVEHPVIEMIVVQDHLIGE